MLKHMEEEKQRAQKENRGDVPQTEMVLQDSSVCSRWLKNRESKHRKKTKENDAYQQTEVEKAHLATQINTEKAWRGIKMQKGKGKTTPEGDGGQPQLMGGWSLGQCRGHNHIIRRSLATSTGPNPMSPSVPRLTTAWDGDRFPYDGPSHKARALLYSFIKICFVLLLCNKDGSHLCTTSGPESG